MISKRILFINMPVRVHAPPNNVPLGPLTLASYLNNLGYEAEILDLNVQRPDEKCLCDSLYQIIQNKIEHADSHLKFKGGKEQYDIVALSGLITTLRYQEVVARIAREILPHSHIISGGGLATDIKAQLFEWIPELDAINIGPGDLTIKEIIKKSKKGKGKKIYFGQPPKDLDKSDKLDFSLVEVEKYIKNPIWGSVAKNSSSTPFKMPRSLNSITSRGCPFKCNYCDKEATSGNTYRIRSARSLLEEMKYLISEYNIDFLGYVDDNATLNKERLIDLSDIISKEGIDLNWGTHSRLDDIGSDEEKAKLLKQMNCVYLGFGGESANKAVLHSMNKGMNVTNSEDFMYDGHKFPKIYVNALENCRKNGIHPNLTWIMGYPGETLKQLKDTIAFILFMEDEGYIQNGCNNHSLFIATAYPNTVLFNTPIVQKKIRSAFPSFKDYIYSLGDATKLVSNNDVMLNYSKMPDRIFYEAKDFINNGEIEQIMYM